MKIDDTLCTKPEAGVYIKKEITHSSVIFKYHIYSLYAKVYVALLLFAFDLNKLFGEILIIYSQHNLVQSKYEY